MTRIMPPRILPGIGGPGRFGGIRGGDFRQRLTGLAARLPAVPAFRPDAVLQRALQTLKAPGAVQRFLQTGRAAFEALQKKYPLKDPGRLPTLPFQPPQKIRTMLPTYPPRSAEVRPKVGPWSPPLVDRVPLPQEILRKHVDSLQKRFPSPEPAFRSPENLLSHLRDFTTEVGRHVPPMGTSVPAIPASELHQHGPLLADPVVGSGAGMVLKKPVSDIDARGPLLAAATEPHLQTLSQKPEPKSQQPTTTEPKQSSGATEAVQASSGATKASSGAPRVTEKDAKKIYPKIKEIKEKIKENIEKIEKCKDIYNKIKDLAEFINTLEDAKTDPTKQVEVVQKMIDFLKDHTPPPFSNTLDAYSQMIDQIKNCLGIILKNVQEAQKQGGGVTNPGAFQGGLDVYHYMVGINFKDKSIPGLFKLVGYGEIEINKQVPDPKQYPDLQEGWKRLMNIIEKNKYFLALVAGEHPPSPPGGILGKNYMDSDYISRMKDWLSRHGNIVREFIYDGAFLFLEGMTP